MLIGKAVIVKNFGILGTLSPFNNHCFWYLALIRLIHICLSQAVRQIGMSTFKVSATCAFSSNILEERLYRYQGTAKESTDQQNYAPDTPSLLWDYSHLIPVAYRVEMKYVNLLTYRYLHNTGKTPHHMILQKVIITHLYVKNKRNNWLPREQTRATVNSYRLKSTAVLMSTMNCNSLMMFDASPEVFNFCREGLFEVTASFCDSKVPLLHGNYAVGKWTETMNEKQLENAVDVVMRFFEDVHLFNCWIIRAFQHGLEACKFDIFITIMKPETFTLLANSALFTQLSLVFTLPYSY